MIGKEYEEYWKQQKKMMEKGEMLIQHLMNQNMIEDNKIESVSRRIVHLAEVRESVKEKEKILSSKRSDYESVEEKELVTKTVIEQKMVNAEEETELAWKNLLEDEEEKAAYQEVLKSLSEKVRDKNNLENIKDENVKNLYMDCFTVEAMLAFDCLGYAAKRRFAVQRKNKKISSKAREYVVQAVQNEKELKKIARDYKDDILEFSNIEETINMNKEQIMQKADEVKDLKSDLENENSGFKQKYKNLYEELKEKGSKQKEQYSSLEKRFHGIEKDMRTLMAEIKENETQKKAFEQERVIQQEYFEDYDKEIKQMKGELEKAGCRAQIIEGMSDEARKKVNKEFASPEKDISAWMVTIPKMANNKQECENLIQGYSDSIKNMEKKQSEITKKLEAKGLEKEQVLQELHQLDKAIQANQADIETLRVQYGKEEEELKSRLEKAGTELKKLNQQSERLQKVKSEMDERFTSSEINTEEAFKFEAKNRDNRAPKEIDQSEMYRAMADQVRNSCRKFLTFEGDNKKSGHSNSKEFKRMMDQLDNIQKLGDEESLNMGTYLDQLREAAVKYKEAKNSQWFHFYPSDMRKTRLAMADGLISYCDQMKQQYQLLDKMTKQVQPLPSVTSNWNKFDKMMEMHRKANIGPANCKEMIRNLYCKKMDTYAKEQREVDRELENGRYSFVEDPILGKLDGSTDMVPMNSL